MRRIWGEGATPQPLYVFRLDDPCVECGEHVGYLSQNHVPVADTDPARMIGTPELAKPGMHVVVLDERCVPHELTVGNGDQGKKG